MNSQRSKKRIRYSGILCEPVKLAKPCCPPSATEVPPSGLSPLWTEIWPLAVQRARRHDELKSQHELDALHDRFWALVDDLDIVPFQPGWIRDLALTLAWRHEQEAFIDAGKKPFAISRVFTKFDIDPDMPSSDLQLAQKLASRHVPGFGLAPPDQPKCRLNNDELECLYLAALTLREQLHQGSRPASIHEIAQVLKAPRRLEAFLTEREVGEVKRLINERGNNRRATPGPLSDRTLRGYISDIFGAWDKYLAGTQNAIQTQLIEQVLPSIYRRQREWENRHRGQTANAE